MFDRPPLLAVVLCVILLSGCDSAPPISSGAICPPVVEYGRDEQSRAATELRAMSSGAVIPTMMADYGRTRAALRACRG